MNKSQIQKNYINAKRPVLKPKIIYKRRPKIFSKNYQLNLQISTMTEPDCLPDFEEYDPWWYINKDHNLPKKTSF